VKGWARRQRSDRGGELQGGAGFWGRQAAGGAAATTTATTFPIDLTTYRPLTLDPSVRVLTAEQRQALRDNIQLCRDVIVFFTAAPPGPVTVALGS
jgi:hypothetical protein